MHWPGRSVHRECVIMGFNGKNKHPLTPHWVQHWVTWLARWLHSLAKLLSFYRSSLELRSSQPQRGSWAVKCGMHTLHQTHIPNNELLCARFVPARTARPHSPSRPSAAERIYSIVPNKHAAYSFCCSSAGAAWSWRNKEGLATIAFPAISCGTYIQHRAKEACCIQLSLFTCRSCLELANKEGLATIAFPAISCGVYAFPYPRAAKVCFKRLQPGFCQLLVTALLG